MQCFRWSLGLVNMVVKDCEGKGRGIAVLWRRGVDVTLRNYSKYHIDMDVKDDEGREWRFTGVYGESQSDLKDFTWQTLRNLISVPVKPWLLAGDFNEILFAHEKEGGKCWRIAGWKIWGLREIGSLGETIIIRLKATSGSD